MTDSVIVVAAAVIERGDRFLVTRRLEGTHLAGRWEFPGGKCEDDETTAACLERELREELGLESQIGPEIMVSEHAYPERTVRLHFLACAIVGEPTSRLGQEICWVTRQQLRTLALPEADADLVDWLVTTIPGAVPRP